MMIKVRTSEQIGEAIRRFRKAKGLTQKDVSKRTNLRTATISSLENGDAGTQLRTIVSVLAALDLEFSLHDRRKSEPVSIEDVFS